LDNLESAQCVSFIAKKYHAPTWSMGEVCSSTVIKCSLFVGWTWMLQVFSVTVEDLISAQLGFQCLAQNGKKKLLNRMTHQ
jgi:hypothetical protein